mgnify:CR=1 FL=1
MSERRIVRCQECETPVFELRDGLLIIKTRHHNKTHVTVITFEVLREWMLNTDQEQRAA